MVAGKSSCSLVDVRTVLTKLTVFLLSCRPETATECEEWSAAYINIYLAARFPPRPVKAVIIMLSCFSVLGLLGNSLVIYVYARKKNKLSSTVFIIALACIDLVTSAVGMPYTMAFEWLNYQVSSDFSCKLYIFVITCTVPFSLFIMVAIAVDRYMCICRPHSHVLDSVRARHSVFALLLAAVVIGVITALFHGVYLDVGSLHNDQHENALMETDVKESMSNTTDLLFLMDEGRCDTCVNHSINEEIFTERLQSVILQLYRSVCRQEHELNHSYIYIGHCITNQIFFSDQYRRTHQTIYSASFLVCFFLVFVLYIMIYRSVLVRRSRRLAARSKMKVTLTQEVSLTENHTVLTESPDKIIALPVMQNGAGGRGTSAERQQSQLLLQRQDVRQQDDQEQHSLQKADAHTNGCVRDKYFLANIRTAIMLFVVTVAFVIAYLPSWLIALKLIPFNVIVFYIYFSNHIVNPIIYAFMNPAFRHSLKALLCRKKAPGLY